MTVIKPVPLLKKSAAIRFLVNGGEKPLPESRNQEKFLADIYRDGKCRGSRLWYVRRKRRITAVAMLSVSRGNVGFLYHCPTASKHVDEGALRDLVTAVSSSVLHSEVPIVQAFSEPDRPEDIAMLTEAGLQKVAELINMNCYYSNREMLQNQPDPDLKFITAEDIDISIFMDLIRSTYIESLDCPKILGLRDTADVLESHRNTGIYSPSSWHIAMIDDVPAGCVLMNSSSKPGMVELVYMGVAKRFRGRGLGSQLLIHGAKAAFASKFRGIHLAVDSGNSYARKLYEEAGFRQDFTVHVFAMF